MTMRKILLVDDESHFCFFLKKNLEAAGDFEVTVCSDGLAALQQARQIRPDLILLDILMPGMTGVDVAEQLKNFPETARIPVVFLTALTTKEETAERRNLVVGGMHMVAKPVKMEELVHVIQATTKDNGGKSGA